MPPIRGAREKRVDTGAYCRIRFGDTAADAKGGKRSVEITGDYYKIEAENLNISKRINFLKIGMGQ